MMETKKRNRKVKTRMEKMEAMMAALVVKPKARKKKRTRTRRQEARSTRLLDGELRIKRKELLESVALAEGKTELVLTKKLIVDSFPWLGNLAKSFEKVKWHAMKAYWKPAVGTTEGGLVTVGMRWDTTKESENRVAVAAQTPSQTCAIWEDGERRPLVLPPARLMTRAWYIIGEEKSDSGPGMLEVGISGPAGKVLGEVWVEYSVTLAGTRGAA